MRAPGYAPIGMETRRVGRSGLKVPVLGLAIDGPEAAALIHPALDAGISLFDVRAGGDVSTQEMLAAALHNNRARAILAARFSLEPVSNGADARAQLVRACDDILRRLRTDHVDIWQLDPLDQSAPLDDVLGALDDLVQAGKIVYTGCCDSAGWHVMKYLMRGSDRRRTRLISHQAGYSVFDRRYEREHLQLAIAEGLGTIVRAVREKVNTPVAAALDAIARDTSHAAPQLAISWILEQPTVCTVLIAPRTAGELEESVIAARWTLPRPHAARLDAFTERPIQMIGPDSEALR